jgi:hypothetical protein
MSTKAPPTSDETTKKSAPKETENKTGSCPEVVSPVQGDRPLWRAVQSAQNARIKSAQYHRMDN